MYEDIICESISVFGQDFYYIPRELVGKDEILGEDRLSKFKNAYGIEMYLESHDGFEGQGAFIQKFGLMMEQSATLTVARRRWEQLVGRFGHTIIPSRPCEGDLLYFPLTGGLFEIKFVKHQDPFYQLGKLFVYKLQIELFQYSSERMQTGIPEVDVFESLKSFDLDIVKDGELKEIVITNPGYSYTTTPVVTVGKTWVAEQHVYARNEVCNDGKRYAVIKSGITGNTAPVTTTNTVFNDGTAQLKYVGEQATAFAIIGTGAEDDLVTRIEIEYPGFGYRKAPPVYIGGPGYEARAYAIIDNIDDKDSFGDNNKFKQEADGVLFNEKNPIGEVGTLITPSWTADSTKITADTTTLTADDE